MTLDKDALEEIRAYMDHRAEAWKLDAQSAAQDAARSEIKAADGRIAKRNTLFLVGVGAVLLTAIGFGYSSITSNVANLTETAKTGAEQIADGVAKKVADDVVKAQLSEGGRLLETHDKLLNSLLNGYEKVADTLAKLDIQTSQAEATGNALKAKLEELEQSLQQAQSALNTAEEKVETLTASQSEVDQQEERLANLLTESAARVEEFRGQTEKLNSANRELKLALEQVGSADKVIDDLFSANGNQLAAAAQEIVNIAVLDENILARIVEAAQFPIGAIVPFYGHEFGDRACPPGWSEFTLASGRFVLGASPTYRPGSFGGEESVTLTEAQMPRHQHRTQVGTSRANFVDKGRFDTGTSNSPTVSNSGQRHPYISGLDFSSSRVGGSQPHNNMPPYIALYFCKKD
ncbi:MAG: phage baseplate protein [Marinibacterium sp.]